MKKALLLSMILALGVVLAPTLINARSEKVTVCHGTQSEKNPIVLIDVSSSAVQTHIDHGDKVLFDGQTDCSELPPPPPPME